MSLKCQITRDIRVRGHNMLLRKCFRPDEGGIVLPDQLKERTNFCEVLAMGEKCGTPNGKRGINNYIEVDDMVYVVESSHSMYRGLLGDESLLIVDEKDIVFYMEGDRMQPLGDRVIVEIMEEDSERGGIVLPDIAKDRPQIGKVVEIGSGFCTKNGDIASDLSVGVEVLMPRFGGTDLEYVGKKCRIISESDVLAILDG